MSTVRQTIRQIARPCVRPITGNGVSGGSSPLLLDSYTGALASYSFRKLRTAYTGNCIRVRRSSDNAEQEIGFSGNTLDTAALLAFSGAGSAFIARWFDQSGEENVLTQSTTSLQARIVDSGTLDVNSNLSPTSFYNQSAYSDSLAFEIGQVATFCVCNPTIDTGTRIGIFGIGTSSTNRLTQAVNVGTSLCQTFYNSTSGLDISSVPEEMSIYESRVDTTNNYARLNGGTEFSGARDFATITAPFNLGRRYGSSPVDPFKGTISEFILFGSALASDARDAVRANQSNFYGVTLP